MKKRIAAMVTCFIMTAATAFAAGPENLLGIWTTEEAKSRVQIFKCGAKYCAKIIALKEPFYTDPADGPVGSAKVDLHNKDAARRKVPIIGLQIMEGFTQTEDSAWGNGTIYDPENGKTYQCKINLEGNRLNVRGFIGISLLGRTTVWTR